MGLVAPWHVESSWTRDWTCVPCMVGRILIHSDAREVQDTSSWGWSWGSGWTVTHLRSSCPLVVESRLKPSPLTSSYGLSILIHTTSWASLVAQMVKNLPARQETWAQSLGWEDPLEEGMAILAWRIPLTEEPGGLQVHGVAMCGTQLSN